MNEQILDVAIKKLILSKSAELFAIDVFKDEITVYNLVDGDFVVNKTENLTAYLESCQNNIPSSYIKGYMGMFSIPKIQEQVKNGQDKLVFKYQALSGKWYEITSMLITNKDSKMIFAINEEIKKSSQNSIIESDDRFNSLISNLSDVILKISNVFDIDAKDVNNFKKIEDYINAILSQLANKYPELKKNLRKNAENISSLAYDSILIVDDDLVTRNMIKKVIDDEYKIVMASNGKEAIDYLEANSSKLATESTDNVLGIFLDLTMPVMDGFAVLEYLSRKNYLSKIPVIIISGDYEKETKARVYNYNIADMLEKPFDFQVVKHRINNFINLYKSSNALGQLISDQNAELKDLVDPFVLAYRYDYEKSIKRVRKYIKILGEQVKIDYPNYALTSELVDKMADASLYYDIGFYSIPRKILNKKEQLNEEELSKIKSYPVFGFKMIEYVLSLTSDVKYKDYAFNIVKYYHENYDGTGYPNNLSGDKIPLEAQIASVAITYNNLLKKVNDPKEIIISKAGKMFNPKIIDSFVKVSDSFLNVK